MSTPEPKFSVGEVVMVRYELNTERSSDHAIVTERQYFVDQIGRCDMTGKLDPPYTGWAYWLDDSHSWTEELLIRKRPPPADSDWQEDFKRMLNPGVVEKGETV